MIANILLLVVAASASAALATPNAEYDEAWADFKLVFNKTYPSKYRETVRRLQWEQNLQYIQSHNLQADMGMHTYSLGVNRYADLSREEFTRQVLSHGGSSSQIFERRYIQPYGINSSLPASVDWRTKGCVSSVKNQDGLFSWAFAASGSLESQVCVKTGELVTLSVQNLVDCVKGFGSVEAAFEYVLHNGGIDTEAGYPYQAQKGPCRFNKDAIGAKIKGIGQVKSGDEMNLQSVVANVGPVAAYIDASHLSFQLYRSGIYNEPNCSAARLDHTVIIVGYGSTGGQDYWIVKNSWGAFWGMKGYILMSRNKNNQCGIATSNTYAIV